jgi:phage protein D
VSKESALSIERSMGAAGEDDASGEPARVKVDGTSGSLRVNLWTYNSGTLAWQKQTFMDIPALITAVDNLTTAINDLVTLLTP